MIISPIDYRYGRDNVKYIFSEENRMRLMLRVEAALAQAEYEYNIISRDAFLDIKNAVDSNSVRIERVHEIESRIHHDTMALVEALTEQCSAGKNFVHFGVTSNDIIDTATAMQIKSAVKIIKDDIKNLMKTLIKLIDENKDSVMVGRTHGQHASPITFGLKLSVYLDEMSRHLKRLTEAEDRIVAGKISGPVGTGASLGKDSIEIQNRVCEILGIKSELASSQIVCRDRYIEYLSIINNIATSLEKFATEIRNLQRPEINEVSEYFDERSQVGSSSMPSKRNPIVSENISSLCRFIRSLIIPEYEAAVIWHERDLANSALERFTIPYASVLIDYVLYNMNDVFSHLYINKEEMLRKARSDEFIMSESIVRALTLSGMPRQEAHEFVRKASMEAYKNNKSLKSSLISAGVLKYIDEKILEAAMDPVKFTGQAVSICNNVINNAERVMKDADE
ncbi:adenylosuccinate lyase [Picrophilus oshimae]|uniref:Adenylosuccinate lyase n=1 Tax=Picrophilus torridus (strain ATCC 700027 / DSM 9790 / JCM 10055 / NBRC 100828 / KAW 2/3) TaxID=1122961 RepID=A0A8G2FVN0_PICTO|nr:adenylosuccinate lyase [Picrophilus oshimae]SMD30289.1 Adenylosuccinate lyase [Picrophilus oshimae DSM 9789]